MKQLRRSLLAAAVIAGATPAVAQQFPTVPDHTVIGRVGIGGASGPSQAIPFSTLLSLIGGITSSRTINTTAPLAGGGNLAADLTLSINANGISNSLFRQSGALSLVGRSANSAGNVADISAVAGSSCAFIESGSTLICGQLATAGIANNAVTLAKLATQAANTTLANATSGAAVPTAFAMPSCSTSASALSWTTNTGFGCNSAISTAIANVTGLGTGVATALGINIGSAGATVLFNGAGGTPSSIALTNGTGLPTTGLTGTLQAAQEPAHTGDVTNSAGSLALSIAANAVTNAKMATMGAWSFKANATSGSATPTDITIDGQTLKASPAAGDEVFIWDISGSAIKKTTVSALASAGSVASIAGNTGAFTLGIGLTNSVNDIRVSLTTASNALGSDVALNNTANYFDGPSMAQGTSGTWFASGQVELVDSAAADISCKLWDGTTVIASGTHNINAANIERTMHLAGTLASPAANIRISCKDVTNTTGSIKFNFSGNSKDSSIYGFRIQ